MITGALCQSMSFGVNPNNVIGTLCFWRFLLGVGIGGNYPLRCPTPHAACAAILRRHPLALFTRSCARMHSPRTRAAPAINRSHPRPAAGMTHCALRRRAAAHTAARRSATVMSETSTTKTRGTYVAAVFAQQVRTAAAGPRAEPVPDARPSAGPLSIVGFS